MKCLESYRQDCVSKTSRSVFESAAYFRRFANGCRVIAQASWLTLQGLNENSGIWSLGLFAVLAMIFEVEADRNVTEHISDT